MERQAIPIANKDPGAGEVIMPPDFQVVRVLKGFEFGHGSISGTAADPAILEQVDRAIHNDPHILVPIEIDDDGCGDGREVLTVFSHDKKFGRSLDRPKVFGGSATMAAACRIGLGEARSETLNEVFDRVIRELDGKGMDFGAHTDEYMHGEKCGCGAIDNAPQILLATLKYELPIRGAATVLSDNTRGLNSVFGNYRQYVLQMAHSKQYSGMQVMDTIINNNRSRVVKQLGGNHHELRIVLNNIRGYTVNQKLVRDVTNGAAQIFAVDVWRMQDIAKGLYPDDGEAQQKALLSELVYTLATAAVLTKGDLPVDLIQQTSA